MAQVQGIAVKIGRKTLFRFQISRLLLYLFMILLSAFMALPLIYVTVTAFKPIEELYLFPPRFFVSNPTFQNFGDLFSALDSSSVPFTRYLFNSLFTAAASVFGTVFFSSMAAYALAKRQPPGTKVLFNLIIMALMFSTYVTQIPNYLVVKELNLLNNYLALILPKIPTAFNLFLMKQFMEQLPDPLLEAARLDGAGEWTILWRIVMPSVKPAWATLVLFSFVANWNDYFSPLVFINDNAMKTLPLAIQNIAGGAGAASLATAGAMAASTLVLILPTILLYVIMQRRVIEAMTYSGIKA